MTLRARRLFKTVFSVIFLLLSGSQFAAAQTNYSAAKIEAFAQCVAAVSDLGDQWMARVQAAGSPEEATALEQQAITEVAARVEAVPGITFEEYKAINAAAQNDQVLFDRIQQALSRLQKN